MSEIATPCRVSPENGAGKDHRRSRGRQRPQRVRRDRGEERRAGRQQRHGEVEADAGVVAGGGEAPLPVQALHVLRHHDHGVGQALKGRKQILKLLKIKIHKNIYQSDSLQFVVELLVPPEPGRPAVLDPESVAVRVLKRR